MNLPTRVLLGIGLGALGALFLNPTSRTLLAASSWKLRSPDFMARTPYRVSATQDLPPSSEPAGAAFYLLAGAIEMRKGTLDPREIDSLIAVARLQASQDPDNAFWRQALSLYLWHRGDRAEAQREWIRAAAAMRWNDYQNERLRFLREGLQTSSGGTLAWHDAVSYLERSDALQAQIARLGASILAYQAGTEYSDLEIRYATVINGRLLRDGARSVRGGTHGASLVDRAALGSVEPDDFSHRRLHLERLRMIDLLSRSGRPDRVEKALDAFASNDAWFALVRPVDRDREVDRLLVDALTASTVPGAFLLVTVTGGLIALSGWFFERSPALQRLLVTPVAPVLGLALAVLTYLWTGMPLVAFFFAVCLSFFAVGAGGRRSAAATDLGRPLLGLLAVLGTLLGLSVAGFAICASAPFRNLAPPLLGIDNPDSLTLVFATAATILAGMVLATAPGWALIKRYAPERLAGTVLRRLGIGLASGALIATIATGLACLVIEVRTQSVLSLLVLNEPLYYLNQVEPTE